ncbi:MAG: radical SAM protein [Candidatus Sericytochromatia bacterium]
MNSPLKVRLVQINQTYGYYHYLPHSTAILESYVKAYAPVPERYQFYPPLFQRSPFQELLKALLDMDIVGICCYAWNYRISMQLATELKRLNPKVLIILGGPMSPERAETFLHEHPAIDVACHGEGEKTFLALLEAHPQRDWSAIPNISYLEQGLFLQHHPRGPRIDNINLIPSPFLDGTYAALLHQNPEKKWIALWETNRGCPFSCTYCDWGSALQSKVYAFDLERIYAEIDWFSEHKIELIWCCDANFGILKRDIDITQKLIENYKKYGYPADVYVQSTKNATERSFLIQKMLFESGVSQNITLSLQSTSAESLLQVKRQNISAQSFKELQNRFQKEGIPTYTDILIGLPGETYTSFIQGIDEIVSHGQHHVIQFYNLYLLPNSEMGDPAYQAKYQIKSIETPFFFIAEPAVRQEIEETQLLVVETNSMTQADWCKMRIFAWWCEILYFKKKLLQIPLLILQAQLQIGLSSLVEKYMYSDLKAFPLLQGIQQALIQQSQGMLRGGPGFFAGGQAPGYWMDIEDFFIVQMIEQKNLIAFYSENYHFLAASSPTGVYPERLLQEAVEFSARHFYHRTQQQDFSYHSQFNLWEYYQGLVQGEPLPLRQIQTEIQSQNGKITQRIRNEAKQT